MEQRETDLLNVQVRWKDYDMKRLTCELCGGTNLIKQDGVFVCQDCGTKYSVEEARKMMVEGVVDVSGSTVKVDTSDKLDNLYQIARRAKNNNNSDQAARYYDMILQEDPLSWEATFYSVYYSSMQTNLANVYNATVKVNNCIGSTLDLINRNVEKDNRTNCVNEVFTHTMKIAHLFRDWGRDHYDGLSLNIKSNFTQEYIDRMFAVKDLAYNLGDSIQWFFPDLRQLSCDAWKYGVEVHDSIMHLLRDQENNQAVIDAYSELISEVDDDFRTVFEEKKQKRAEVNAITARKELKSRIKMLDSEIYRLENKTYYSGIFSTKTPEQLEKMQINDAEELKNLKQRREECTKQLEALISQLDDSYVKEKLSPLNSQIEEINIEIGFINRKMEMVDSQVVQANGIFEKRKAAQDKDAQKRNLRGELAAKERELEKLKAELERVKDSYGLL